MARLPDYLRALTALLRADTDTVSSGDLAAAAGVTSAQLRKDLSLIGSHGVRGVGYDVEHLIAAISGRLDLTHQWPVVIVGAGRLGQALARYPGLADGGFQSVTLLDRDPAVIGTDVGGVAVRDVADLPELVHRLGHTLGVVATPAAGAQDACDRLVAAGVRSILTFAPVVLSAPDHVHLRRVDVATELQVLAFRAQPDIHVPTDPATTGAHRGAAAAGAPDVSDVPGAPDLTASPQVTGPLTRPLEEIPS